MNVYLTTTTKKYKKYKKYYLALRQHLIDKGHVITDDWIGLHGKWIEENPYGERGIRDVYEKVRVAIHKADAVIVEFTVPNFSSSHQITYSLSRNVPTLVMRLRKDVLNKDPYIEAINSPYLTIKDYNLSNYGKVIDEFLGYAEIEGGQKRYNIVLGSKHKYYLDWASNKYDKSRSQIIKELINEKMRNDSDFKKVVSL